MLLYVIHDTSNEMLQKVLEYKQTNACKSRNVVEKSKGGYSQAINLK